MLMLMPMMDIGRVLMLMLQIGMLMRVAVSNPFRWV